MSRYALVDGSGTITEILDLNSSTVFLPPAGFQLVADFTGLSAVGGTYDGTFHMPAPPAGPSLPAFSAGQLGVNIWTGEQTISHAGLTLSGDLALPAWTTNGIRLKSIPGTLTDSTSSGTVPAAYTNILGGNTIAAANATVFTDYYATFITQPVAGTNVTMTSKWALGLSGAIKMSGLSLSGSQTQPLIDLSATWNTTGLPTAVKLNIVDTASNAASLFLDFLVSSVSKFSIDKTGIVQAARFQIGTATSAGVTSNKLCVSNIGVIQWTGGASAFTAGDTILARDAANVLALRNTTSAQAFRVYGTFTDASNYERGALNAGADYIELAAETAGTGDDNMDVRLTPAGTGNVRFGVVTGNADAPVTGYVTIKDAAGNSVKLATIA